LAVGTQVVQAKRERKKPAEKGDFFYVYSERGSRLNHYIPSGWMGDYGDLKMNQGWSKNIKKPKMKGKKKPKVKKGKEAPKDETCIQLRYSAERKQGAGWAGIYWQHPANNWGDRKGGYDLTGFKKLTFWARGEEGGEIVDKFLIGGITGQTEDGDSDEATISPVELSKDWQLYEIDLDGLDLSHIIGGFGFAANSDANPDGFVIYIDEIRLEKTPVSKEQEG